MPLRPVLPVPMSWRALAYLNPPEIPQYKCSYNVYYVKLTVIRGQGCRCSLLRFPFTLVSNTSLSGPDPIPASVTLASSLKTWVHPIRDRSGFHSTDPSLPALCSRFRLSDGDAVFRLQALRKPDQCLQQRTSFHLARSGCNPMLEPGYLLRRGFPRNRKHHRHMRWSSFAQPSFDQSVGIAPDPFANVLDSLMQIVFKRNGVRSAASDSSGTPARRLH